VVIIKQNSCIDFLLQNKPGQIHRRPSSLRGK